MLATALSRHLFRQSSAAIGFSRQLHRTSFATKWVPTPLSTTLFAKHVPMHSEWGRALSTVANDLATQVLRTANVVNIRQELDSLAVSHIPYSHFVSICGKYGLNEDEAMALSEHLHRSGVALHFRDRDSNHDLISDELEGHIILHPDEVVEDVLRKMDLKTSAISQEIVDLEKKIQVASVEYVSEKGIMEELDAIADRSATKQMWAIGGYLFAQAALFAHLTWFGVPPSLDWIIADWFQTWDEVEPFSWHVGYISVVAGAFFYARNRRNFDFVGIYDSLKDRKLRALHKRFGFEPTRFNTLESGIKSWQQRLDELNNSRYFDIMGTIELESGQKTSPFRIHDVPHVSVQVATQIIEPTKAIKIRQALQKDGRGHIPFRQFEEVCALYGVSGKAVEELALSMNESGVVLWLNKGSAGSMINAHPENVIAEAFNSIDMYGTKFMRDVDKYNAALTKYESEYYGLMDRYNDINDIAHRGANRKLWIGAGYLIAQALTFAYYTVDWGWDIIEPMTFHATFATGILWYGWFSYHKTDGNYTDLHDWLKQRAVTRIVNKEGFDLNRMKALEKLIDETRETITSLTPYSRRGTKGVPEALSIPRSIEEAARAAPPQA